MPQYELMYLLGAQVADEQVPEVSQQILKYISDFGGTNIVETQLGKKKLAYPIKKTRNGHYVVVNFNMDGKKVNELDAKIHSQDSTIIRYLMVNQDEHLARIAKDKIVQSKIIRREPIPQTEMRAPEPIRAKAPAAPLIDIDQETLDKKIEEALSEDLTK